MMAVAKGEFPLASENGMSYWDLLRLICDQDPPELGPGYSNQFNMFMNACLQQDPKDRPTVTMLLQHPFFIKHAKVISHLTYDKSFDEPIRLDDAASEEDPFERMTRSSFSSAVGDVKFHRPSLDANTMQNPSRLSRLTARSLSLAHSVSTSDLPHPSAVVLGGADMGPRQSHGQGSYSPTRSGPDEEDMMTAVRLEHLERVLEKTETKYNQMVALYRQEKLERKQMNSGKVSLDSGNVSGFASGGSFRSMMSSRSFLKSANDPMTPIPNFTSGRRSWEHLAHQLHLPVEIVISTAVNILNTKYLARDS
jgi:serine/threonine protein kinase